MRGTCLRGSGPPGGKGLSAVSLTCPRAAPSVRRDEPRGRPRAQARGRPRHRPSHRRGTRAAEGQGAGAPRGGNPHLRRDRARGRHGGGARGRGAAGGGRARHGRPGRALLHARQRGGPWSDDGSRAPRHLPARRARLEAAGRCRCAGGGDGRAPGVAHRPAPLRAVGPDRGRGAGRPAAAGGGPGGASPRPRPAGGSLRRPQPAHALHARRPGHGDQFRGLRRAPNARSQGGVAPRRLRLRLRVERGHHRSPRKSGTPRARPGHCGGGGGDPVHRRDGRPDGDRRRGHEPGASCASSCCRSPWREVSPPRGGSSSPSAACAAVGLRRHRTAAPSIPRRQWRSR